MSNEIENTQLEKLLNFLLN